MSGLDEAWAAAEAALPKNWRGPVLRRSYDFPDQYWALAEEVDGDRFREGYGKTPSAALTALTDVLGPETKTARVSSHAPSGVARFLAPEPPATVEHALLTSGGWVFEGYHKGLPRYSRPPAVEPQP